MTSSLRTHSDSRLDRSTSAAIRNAIGERLRRDLGSDDAGLPSQLQMLLNEFDRRDRSSTT